MSTSPSNLLVCYRHPNRRAGVVCQRCDRPICPDCMKTASVGFHCPECTKSGKQKIYTRATLNMINRPVLTQVLIGINAAVFLAGMVYESANALAGRGGFSRLGGLVGDTLRFSDIGVVHGVEDGEVWRIVTSGFLHAGLLHLGLNMLALWNLGQVLEPALGRLRFGTIYATSMLCGSFGVLLLSPDQLTVGASGAVFGLMGALFVTMRAKGIDPFSTGVGGVIGMNLLITFLIPGISIGGHLGGLAGGAAAAWVLLEGGKSLGTQQAVAAAAGLGVLAAVGCVLVA